MRGRLSQGDCGGLTLRGHSMRHTLSLSSERVRTGLILAVGIPWAFFVGRVVVQYGWRLAIAPILIGLLGLFSILSTKFLIFLTALILMIHQTYYAALRAPLEFGRWVPFFLLAFVALALGARFRRLVRRLQWFDLLILVFLVYAFLSVLYSLVPWLTLQRATTLALLYVGVFWAIWSYAEVAGEEVIDALLKAGWVVYIIGIALIPVWGSTFQVGATATYSADQFRGILENANTIGLLTAILLPLALWRALERGRKHDLALVAVMAISIVLSWSRGGLLAAIPGASYFLYRQGKHRLAATALWVLPSGAVVASLLVSPKLFQSFVQPETLFTGSGRSEAWSAAMHLIAEKPILGYGFGSEDRLFSLFGVTFREFAGAAAHNSYLGVTLQLGLIGATLFFGPLFWLLVRELRLSRQGRLPLVRYALQGVLIAGLVAGLAESWIYSVGNAFVFPFWTSVMLLVRLGSQSGGKGDVRDLRDT
jgi:O-antigen ligase